MFRLSPLLCLGLGACVLILAPLDGGGDTDTDGGSDTDDTEAPTCAGTVTLIPEAGGEQDLTATFAAGTAAAPAAYELQEPGTLRFCAGTWFVAITVSADAAALEGVGEAVLSGGEAGRIVHFTGADELVLADLALVDGEVDGEGEDGGAVLAVSGDLEVVGCTFRDNEARDLGGAIAVLEGSLEVSGSDFFANEAVAFGGAIYAHEELTVSDSHLEGNLCVDSSSCCGGAMFIGLSAEPVAIARTTFVDNEARNSGGAIYVLGRVTTLTDAHFTGNRAELFNGGAVFATNTSTVDLVRPLFEENDAVDGGALYLSDSSATCTAMTDERAGFFRNEAAVYLLGGQVVSDGCDWGEPGEDENPVYDMRLGSASPVDFRFGDDASFTCSGSTCE